MSEAGSELAAALDPRKRGRDDLARLLEFGWEMAPRWGELLLLEWSDVGERTIERAELVFCMTGSHRDAARMLVADRPEHLEKIHCLDPAADIEDPIGQGWPAYDALAQRLMELVPQRLKETVVS